MNKMNILVGYDVNTETSAGRKRLKKVAQVCKDFGQRVQLSLFECKVDPMQMEVLRSRLVKIIEPETDSLKIYRLFGERDNCVESYGVENYRDFDEPLIV
jgi:CRISPR-associated protein Cas2